MRDFLPVLELLAKAARNGYRSGCDVARSGLGAVGALVDCGIPRQHAGAQWLTEFEEENEVLEVPLSADFTDDPVCPQDGISPYCFVGSSYCLYCPHAPAAGANGSAVEDPSVGVPPAPTEADSLTHLAQCLRDAVGDHYDFSCRPYDQFPFWHDDHLIDAFDWEGATTAFLEDVVRQLIDEK